MSENYNEPSDEKTRWRSCSCRSCTPIQSCINAGTRVLQKECFTNLWQQSSFFYWVIVIWIFLIIVCIAFYGVLLVGFFTLHDTHMTKIIMNIMMQIINGLFTFAAVLNLPVRVKRLYNLSKTRREDLTGHESLRKDTQLLIVNFPSKKKSVSKVTAQEWDNESELIFDRLNWSTQFFILQALLWNSLFQIINQFFRFVYHTHESAESIPGVIWVNAFFPLAILAGVIAATTQAIAENRWRDAKNLSKKPNNFKRFLVEFWHNLWKDQTEGQTRLAKKYDNPVPETNWINLRKSTVMNPDALEEIEVDECIRSRSTQLTLGIPGENAVINQNYTDSSERKAPWIRKVPTPSTLEVFERRSQLPGEIQVPESISVIEEVSSEAESAKGSSVKVGLDLKREPAKGQDLEVELPYEVEPGRVESFSADSVLVILEEETEKVTASTRQGTNL